MKRRLVLSTIAKNGAPQKAVTTPIGSSGGETTVRATTSARTRKPPPKSSGERHDQPVARAEREPDRVGDDDPDERDQTADRDGGGGPDRREQDDGDDGCAGRRCRAPPLPRRRG